ncbi:MAG: fumarylacetoacetate hydrolase family protein [Kiritimatiellae bacterium]|nr:fumarylacetoacetate hydrolase family protein [Kiritimatiellia bacterium]MDD5520150.1 fumarylacetoacetate hydrolase family protein [Kiritimatiellia bacterium]
MRLVMFTQNARAKLGAVLEHQYIVDLKMACQEFTKHRKPLSQSDTPFCDDMRGFLEQGEPSLRFAHEVLVFVQKHLASQPGKASLPSWIIPKKEVKLTAPIPNPQKVVAIGQNYRDHCAEQGVPVPDMPVIFAKFPTAVIGPDEAITWNPDLTNQVDYEAELAVVIGKRAKNVSREDAFEYIAGYMNGNDVSARNLQFGDQQWVRGKSLDTFCPIGPYLVTKDEIPDPHHLAIRAILNGRVMQDSNTSNLIFGVPALIEFITRAITLLPGDVILTGTPPGVGVFRKPPVFLKPGDTITVEIEGLGTLTNPVVEWSRQ